MPWTYDYPRPAVTVDAVLIGCGASGLEVLVIQRKHPPFRGAYAFPGGFVDEGEDLAEAMHRELQEETGLLVPGLVQCGAFGAPGRDPRGHTVTIAYTAWLTADAWAALRPVAADDAESVERVRVLHHPQMAFDHPEILKCALRHHRLRLPAQDALEAFCPSRIGAEAFQNMMRALREA